MCHKGPEQQAQQEWGALKCAFTLPWYKNQFHLMATQIVWVFCGADKSECQYILQKNE